MGVNTVAKARDDVVRAEAKLEHARRQHAKTMGALAKAVQKMRAAIAERSADVVALDARRAALAEGVALRERIIATRAGGAAPPGSAALAGTRTTARAAASAPPPRALPEHISLAATVHEQAREIEALKEEVRTLEQRNFPMFPAPRK